MAEISYRSPKILFIIAENEAGAFVSPKGMTVYSNRPYLHLKAVLVIEPACIRKLW